LIRGVSRSECRWLKRDFLKGETVYEYTGPTYGCISRKGVACSEVEGKTPFFELPADAVGKPFRDLFERSKDGC